ncbi:MAG: hypothetical protein J6J86_02275 [Lachnospiraceae bacterium]|nr:hypothetical protein [Lachnospiraceae bacterium]
MRITTMMLNTSLEKAGMPAQKSLLDYINQDSSKNTLLDALNGTSSVESALKSREYEKLEDTADILAEKTSVLTAEEDTIFDKIRDGEDAEILYADVEEFVESYNSTIDMLKTSDDSMNKYYYQMLVSTASENKEALSEIGISISSAGKLTVDKDKLKAAGVDAIERILGNESEFMEKTAFLAEKVSDNAQANLKSVSTCYNAKGYSYTNKTSKYDARG